MPDDFWAEATEDDFWDDAPDQSKPLKRFQLTYTDRTTRVIHATSYVDANRKTSRESRLPIYIRELR